MEALALRSSNSIKNFIVGIVGHLITLVLGFVSRYLFLFFLSVEYLGASGLFSNILTMLSLAELGVGTAIVYSLYKPLAENNKDEILALMNLFKRVYRVIGIFVLVAGTALLPFLGVFIKDDKGIDNIQLIYFLFVCNTAVSYFFSYNRSLITADQKNYKLVKIDYAYKVLHILIPIAALALTRNYIVYLIVQMSVTFIWNMIVFFKVRKNYPVLREKRKVKLRPEVKKAILKNTAALMIYKVAVVVTSGTDNMLISYFFGLTAVGLCSNYTLVLNSMTSLLSQGINAITASIGNLSSTENDDKKYSIFKVVFFVNFWIYSFACIGLYFCMNPLIGAVFGKDYVIGYDIIIPMIVSFFLLGMQGATSVFRDAQGLFWQGKLRPIAQTIVNLGSSILLAKLTGNVGAIFWGTFLSRLLTIFWFDPYVVHKHGFHKPLTPYFKRYAVYVLSTLTVFAICFFVTKYITVDNLWIELIINVIICTVTVNGAFLLFFHRTAEFTYIKKILLLNFNNLKRNLKREG